MMLIGVADVREVKGPISSRNEAPGCVQCGFEIFE